MIIPPSYCRYLWVLQCYLISFLFTGSVQSSPIPGKFSFEVSLKLEVLVVRFGEDVLINCKTNDASATVTFKVIRNDYPSNNPQKPGKITQSGTTFTIHDIALRDGGKYQCVAERNDGQKITRNILLTFDTSEHFIKLIYLNLSYSIYHKKMQMPIDFTEHFNQS